MLNLIDSFRVFQMARSPKQRSYLVSVVMVVQPGEKNIMDQKMLEVALWENHHVNLRRVSLAEVAQGGSLDEDGALLVSGGSSSDPVVEVSVAYFRAG